MTKFFQLFLKCFLLMFCLRVGFYFYNFDLYRDYSFVSDALAPLLYGARFDLAVTSLIFMVALIPMSFNQALLRRIHPALFSTGRHITALLFTLLVTASLIISVADYELTKFMGRKATNSFFDFGVTILDQFVSYISEYWLLSLLAVASAAAVSYYSFKSIHSLKFKNRNILIEGAQFFLLMAFAFVGVRGGLQERSISSRDAFVFEDYHLGNLALNSTYSYLRSLDSQGPGRLQHFASDETPKEILRARNNQNRPLLIQPMPEGNVVLILVESLSSEFMGAINPGLAASSLTPFLDGLSEQSLFFKNSFANGSRSMQALPAAVASLPHLLDKTVYRGPFQQNFFHTTPLTLKDQGFARYFFQGSDKADFGFGSYVESSGFQKYFSKAEYDGDAKNIDPNWGVYDRPYLNYVVNKLTDIHRNEGKFYSMVFTLSSHHPFNMEPGHERFFDVSEHKILQMIAYADHALEEFFEQAKKTDWYDNTLFIITGDHTYNRQFSPGFRNTLGQYRVPMLFFHPTMDLAEIQKERPQLRDKVVSLVDIFPSITDFLGLELDWQNLMGQSVFREEAPGNNGFVVNRTGESFYIYENNRMVTFTPDAGEGISTFYSVDDDLGEITKVEPTAETNLESYLESLSLLKAYLQFYTNGLISNRLYD